MTNIDTKISILVPVYNVQNYLPRCLDSLLAQTLQEIEIILIDDGSTDKSGEMCDEYAAKHSRVRVIHQPNAGLSAARNTGLKAAKGKYVLFVDSDDYIDLQSGEKLYSIATKYDCDIVRGNSWSINEQKKHPYKPVPVFDTPVSGKQFLQIGLSRGGVSMCAPFALYKRELLIKNELYFYPGILHEDELWTPQVYLKAQRVCAENEYFYYHWTRENSITGSSWTEKRKSDLLFVCEQLYPLYQKLQAPLKYLLLDYLCMLYLHAINQMKDAKANRFFPIKTSSSNKNRIKALLFFFSPALYFKINRMVKK